MYCLSMWCENRMVSFFNILRRKVWERVWTHYRFSNPGLMRHWAERHSTPSAEVLLELPSHDKSGPYLGKMIGSPLLSAWKSPLEHNNVTVNYRKGLLCAGSDSQYMAANPQDQHFLRWWAIWDVRLDEKFGTFCCCWLCVADFYAAEVFFFQAHFGSCWQNI